MAINEIPLSSDGSQEFIIVIDGITYQFEVSYNSRMKFWTANILIDNVPIVQGIALVGGVDIVAQYIFELKNLWAINITGSDSDATGDNLGEQVLLLKIDADTIAEI